MLKTPITPEEKAFRRLPVEERAQIIRAEMNKIGTHHDFIVAASNLYDVEQLRAVRSFVSQLNAKVPTDAAMLPPQVFADNMSSALDDLGMWDLSNKGITFIRASIVANRIVAGYASNGVGMGVNLSGNNLGLQNVLDILNACADTVNSSINVGNAYLSLQGGTNAAVPKQDALSVQDAGIINPDSTPYNGRTLYTDGSTITIRWSGTHWERLDGGGDVVETSTSGDVAHPWLATWPSSVITQADNASIITMRDNGWNVITN